MKIFSIIEDGDGLVHVAATRAPDLLRREIGAEFGPARLIWCSLPPPGITADRLCAKLDTLLAGARVDAGVYGASSRAALRLAYRLCILEPTLRRLLELLVRPFRRARRRLALRLRQRG